jgi:hypothetical protein
VPDVRTEFSRTTNSDKIFLRTDLNVRPGHRLTVRHNYVKGLNDIGSTGTTSYTTPDGFYQISSKTNGTVVQLNSTFGASVNELRVAFTTIRDRRGAQDFEPKPFPRVSVDVSAGRRLTSGRENFSTANELDQDVLEIHNDFTMIRGNHVITLGTHNELFDFRNLFIRDNFGTYIFTSLDFFEQGLAQRYDHSFSATGNPRQAAAFGVNQFGFYVGDQWRLRPNLTATLGLRADIPTFPDTPTENPIAEQNFGFRTNVTPGGVLLSPRAGFNWDVAGNGRSQLRGGLGVFSGRTPYVWISNQYGNTGIEFSRIGTSQNSANRIPFEPDALNQPKVVVGAPGSSFTNEIDLIDPDYRYPTLVRGNLAIDRQLPWGGLFASAELLFTRTIDDIKYQNLNFQITGSQAVDGRPIFSRKVSSLSDVIFLTNSGEGSAWSVVLELKRPFRGGWFASGSYLYGESKTTMDGTSSQAASNWGFVYVPGDTNNPPLARSVYDPGHRINLSGSYDFPIVAGVRATASVYYAGQSGRPYTLAYNSDVNGDGRFTNDLLYIPASASEMSFTNGTYDDLVAFLRSRGCLAQFIGEIIPRNACRSPWTNTLDFRLNVGVPMRRAEVELTLDVLNLINLFDADRGLVEYASFNQFTSPFVPVLSSGQLTGVNLGNLNTGGANFLRDDLRSRWQLQLGARVRF